MAGYEISLAWIFVRIHWLKMVHTNVFLSRQHQEYNFQHLFATDCHHMSTFNQFLSDVMITLIIGPWERHNRTTLGIPLAIRTVSIDFLVTLIEFAVGVVLELL